ncbi:type II toxin-antitoxin system RelE/ParE family toxin [Agrobacterium genomosp. 3]|nr:type II toxin-antitoxin system RelE/ParE family toxin [Agrobacterium tomkonis]MCA1879373.1 type II toxin-antitoxin system RelE/ParE family toxin [Agrobacterium tumefaciens]MCA1894536.1 type II toxin-antitoxin system RelE/ParE family toxin [Agrobacterium tomkonis]
MGGSGTRRVRNSPAAAARVIFRIVSAVDMLVEHPAMGRVGRIRGTREAVLSDISYIIAYRVGRDIEVLTIIHTSQRWPSAL